MTSAAVVYARRRTRSSECSSILPFYPLLPVLTSPQSLAESPSPCWASSPSHAHQHYQCGLRFGYSLHRSHRVQQPVPVLCASRVRPRGRRQGLACHLLVSPTSACHPSVHLQTMTNSWSIVAWHLVNDEHVIKLSDPRLAQVCEGAGMGEGADE
ncbi:uncharacterized protein C8Q71DRAFT_786786 [Rhodofomes roseus]|uniref:Uncharacterized protein n=1 Tax=Rhodofomes roseus TaxID=34475 RepID=A0ABQ8K1F9_9APHY|nr:uncharacterized protein C8Q71DRAFT_786786 [Rhodofomes roseus]KAH9830313.1 hypothetical protein C8Q71DRAFT_786786 [Rhodofomes roseus]